MTVRVSPHAIRMLRQGKTALRQRRRAMTLPEKVQQVVKLQEIHLKLIRRRREPKPHERVWRLH